MLLALCAIVGTVSRDAVRVHRGAADARLKCLPRLARERASAGGARPSEAIGSTVYDGGGGAVDGVETGGDWGAASACRWVVEA